MELRAGGICGVGIVLKMSSDHLFKIHLVVGTCSNIKAELLGLWGLLHFALRLHIHELMVVGDSKVILDWFDGKSHLNVLSLQTWKRKIKDLKLSFRWIQCFHVHRKFNSLADTLSKIALEKQIGWLFYDEVLEDSVINTGSFFIF
jgi:ribonuclease HI